MFDFEKFPAPDYMNVAALDKLQRSVVTHYNSEKGRENLHLLLDAYAKHAVAHNSGERLTALVNALPANANKDGIKTWVHDFTSLKWLKNKEGNLMFLSRDSENAKVPCTYNLAGSATPFYDMQKVKDKQEKPFDLISGLENLIKRGISARKNGKMQDKMESVLLDMLAAGLPSAIEAAKAKVANVDKPAETAAEEIAPLAVAA